MLRALLIAALACGCGRLGFDARSDGGTSADAPACTADTDCGRCQRCENQRCEAADFVQLSLGLYNACAVDERGDVWCWGANDYNNQGLVSSATPANILRPRRIGLGSIAEVATGWGINLARHTDGTLWGWGTFTSKTGISQLDTTGGWDALTVDRFNGCARAATGKISCVGDNSFGQLGRGTAVTDEVLPLGQFDPSPSWTTVTTGEVTCVLDSTSRLFCLGSNAEGQLGRTTVTNVEVTLGEVATSGWTSVSTNIEHTCALRVDGSAWCWGHAPENGTFIPKLSTPTRVDASTSWESIEAQFRYTCGVRAGQLVCWGRDDAPLFAALGITNQAPAALPIAFDPGTRPVLGGSHACVRDGGIWKCLGANSRGQLGIDSVDPQVRQPAPLCEP